ncbi:hypothetical protein JB92DRAFT_2721118 [Gautieria morchelliformis]|nr:hypothetical protein JB92DRAFT_2721118 [Gautieria morchelliformis]
MARDLTASSFIFHGALITPQDPYVIKYLPHALICIEDGIIQWIEEDIPTDAHVEAVLSARGLQKLNLVKLQRGEFLLPGFVDTHTHAPQFPNLGRGGQYELLDWLANLTFPTESKFGDAVYAKKVYASVVRRLLACGTTTCCYFSSTHLVGTKVLIDVVHASGQRAFIGNCNMDRNAPASYLDRTHTDSLANSRCMISYVNSFKSVLLRPILTPRFALSCTDDLLSGLGKLAAEAPATPHPARLPIQTHISENTAEILVTASLFPAHASYAAVYDDFGLLGPTTILAHGCHLSDTEIALVKKAGAGISHCPTSNFNLSSGVARVGEWLDEGVKVGLGTDVSGGYSASMLTAIQHASLASKVVTMQAALPRGTAAAGANSRPPSPSSTTTTAAQTRLANRPLPTATLLHMATLGGAALCNLESRIGSFAPGKDFDALLVSLLPETANPNVWWEDGGGGGDGERQGWGAGEHDGVEDLEASLEKFLFCGDDRNISAVFVRGSLVGGQTFPPGVL